MIEDIKKLLKQFDSNPDESNTEGKRQLVSELVEFMEEKQLNELINQFRKKVNKK